MLTFAYGRVLVQLLTALVRTVRQTALLHYAIAARWRMQDHVAKYC